MAITPPVSGNRPSRLSDFFISVVLSACLFFALTGGVFLVGWEALARLRKLPGVLVVVITVLGLAGAAVIYAKDRARFFSLEPMRSIRNFAGWPPFYSVGLLAAVFFITQFAYQLALHYGMETGLWDLGFFDQVLWNTARGDFLITSVRGGVHVFGEHFKPILILLAPIYWLSCHITALLAVTMLIHATTLIAVYLIANKVTGSHTCSLALALCVFFYRPMINGINFLYHTQMLADPLLLFGFYFVLRRNALPAAGLFILALMCKENIALDVLGIGLFLIAGKRKSGWAVAALALLWFCVFVLVVEPHFRLAHHFRDKWLFYDYFIHPKAENLKCLLKPNPAGYLIVILGPFLFLSLYAKGWYWLLGPSLLLRLGSAVPEMRMIKYHYSGGLDALVFIAAIYGFWEWTKSSRNVSQSGPVFWKKLKDPTCASLLLVVTAFLFAGTPQLYRVEKFMREVSKPENQRVTRILESIPSRYSVMTIQNLAPHLSRRSRLYVFCSMFPGTPYEVDAKNPDLVVYNIHRNEGCDQNALTSYTARGYRMLLACDFMQIFVRPDAAQEVSATCLARWEAIKKEPVTDYRKRLHFWYRCVVFAGAAWLAILFGLRYVVSRRSCCQRYKDKCSLG